MEGFNLLEYKSVESSKMLVHNYSTNGKGIIFLFDTNPSSSFSVYVDGKDVGSVWYNPNVFIFNTSFAFYGGDWGTFNYICYKY